MLLIPSIRLRVNSHKSSMSITWCVFHFKQWAQEEIFRLSYLYWILGGFADCLLHLVLILSTYCLTSGRYLVVGAALTQLKSSHLIHYWLWLYQKTQILKWWGIYLTQTKLNNPLCIGKIKAQSLPIER